MIDISDLKETQKRLERLNERYTLALKSGQLGIWEYDGKAERLIWDEQMHDIYQIKKEDFHETYEDWKRCVHPDDLEKTEEFVFNEGGGGAPIDYVFRIFWPDGSLRYIASSAVVHRDKDGQPLRIVGVNMDITEQRLVQQRVKEAKDLAEEITRLKSNFLANMSHEIRTPLNGILGLLPMLKIEEDPESLEEIIDMMGRSGKRLLQTLTGILELARIEAEQTDYTLKPNNLQQLVSEVFYSLESVAHGKSLSYELNKSDRELFVLGDDRMLSQIFSNMIGNALKFTQKGRVRVDVSPIEIDGKTYVQTQIIDTRVGIASENLENIFLPFKQESEGIKRKFEGSGLGLSIAKRYAELLEGQVQVQSHKGKGSTFSVLLPIYQK